VLALQRAHPDHIRGYRLRESELQWHARARSSLLDAGLIGIKLARAGGRMIRCSIRSPRWRCSARPILQHICSIAAATGRVRTHPTRPSCAALARRHPDVAFILAHISGGGDWLHSLHAVTDVPNVFVDLSGSGVDGGIARGLHRKRRRESPALGQRHHDGHGLGQAPLSRDLPLQGTT